MKTTSIRAFYTLTAALLLHFSIAGTVRADSLYTTLEFTTKPGQSAHFLDFMKVNAIDTRNFKGCKYFAILVDENNPQHVFFYEVWESREDHAAYQKWRADTGFASKVQPFLAGPPVRNAYTLVQD